MSDIFISYASQDRERILPIVHALEKTGWSIFWDRTIPPGKTWRQLIGSEIQSARCVIVVWTAASIESRWVQEEAEIGSRKGILIPVSLDEVEPPFGFGTIQSANLAGWDGDASLPPFGQLLEAISSILGTSPADQSEQEARRKGEEQAGKEAAERKQKAELEVRNKDIADKPGQPASAIAPSHEDRPDVVANRQQATPLERSPGLGSSKWIKGTAMVAIAAVVAVLVFMTTPFERNDSDSEIESETDTVSTPIKTEAKEDRRVAGEVFRDTLRDGSKGPEMVFIAGGKFEMGSDPKVDSDTQGYEQPRHEVTIEAFYIGKYEVTFDEYESFAHGEKRDLPKDEGWGRGQRPVINVSWQDAMAYSKWLSEQTGKRYRLPTEAEWEYAARAGTATKYWWGNDIQQDGQVWANCDGCGSQWDGKQTAPVGSLKPNPFGVYDTAGNVYEWVQDCWHDSYEGSPDDGLAWEAAGGGECARRVFRGGSWGSPPRYLRSATRIRNYPDRRYINLGFRLAQDVE